MLVDLADVGRCHVVASLTLGLWSPVTRAPSRAWPSIVPRLRHAVHLLTHASGLPADDWATFGGGDGELARYVAEQDPTWPLRLPLWAWWPVRTPGGGAGRNRRRQVLHPEAVGGLYARPRTVEQTLAADDQKWRI